MSKETRLMKNTMIIAIGNVCTKCISFFMLPLYTSILSTAEYGTVDMINVIISLSVIILTFQLEQAVFRYLVEARNESEKQKEYITSAMIFSIMVSLVCVIVLFVFFQIINYQYTIYVVGTILLNVLSSFLLQISRGVDNTVVYSIGSFINGSLNVVLNVVFIAFLGWKIEGMLLAALIAHMASSCYLGVKIKIWTFLQFKMFKMSSLKKLLKYSFPLIPNTLCWWIINGSDRVVINTFIGVAANGIYSVAYKFPTVFSMITNVFHTSWTESAAENVDSNDNEIFVQRIMSKTIRIYSSANIGIIAVMPFIFPVLVSEAFQEAYLYVPLLMTGALFHSVANLYGSLYTALKKTKEIAKTTLLAAILNLGINIVFAKYIGIYASAISTVLAYAIITIVRHKGILHDIKISHDKKYLIIECTIYIVVFGVYYFGNMVLKMCVLGFLVPYCVVQNKEIVKDTFILLKKWRTR